MRPCLYAFCLSLLILTARAAEPVRYELALTEAGKPTFKLMLVAGRPLQLPRLRFQLVEHAGGVRFEQLSPEGAVLAALELPAEGGAGAVEGWQVGLRRQSAEERAAERAEVERQRLALALDLQARPDAGRLPVAAGPKRVTLKADKALLAAGHPRLLPQFLVFDAEQRLILVTSGFTTLEALRAEIDAASARHDAPRLSLSQALSGFRAADGEPLQSVPPGRIALLVIWGPGCAFSKRAREALEAHLQERPDSDWVWLDAEADRSAYRRARSMD
jgi:hypothetical protein